MARPNKLGVWVGGCVALLLAAAVVLVVALRKRGAEGTGGIDAAPPGQTAAALAEPTGVMARGGAPNPGSPVIAAALRELMPRWVVALDRWSTARFESGDVARATADLDAAEAAFVHPALADALGVKAAAALRELATRCRAVLTAAPSERQRHANAVERAMLVVNAELAAAGHPFVLDTEVRQLSDGRPQLLAFGFSVERVSLYRSGERTLRALQVRRLDKLNWSYNLLGFASPNRREALVLLDQVDDRLVHRVLPVLARRPPSFYELEPDELASKWHRTLHRAVVEAVRAGYGDLPGASPADLQRLGDLLAERKAMFARWVERLSVAVPGTLTLQWDWRAELEPHVSAAELTRLGQIERALAEPAMVAAFAAARDRLTRSIERHELQHRLDHLRKRQLPLPVALRDFVGDEREPDGRLGPGPTLARAELSAYLAELSRDPHTPGVGLAIIAQFAIDSDYLGSPESYAAIVLLEQLAARTGKAQTLVVDKRVARDRVAAVYERLTALPPRQLRTAAAELWAALYQAPLPPLTWAGK